MSKPNNSKCFFAISMVLHDKIKQLLLFLRKGTTQSKLSSATGISQITMNNIVSGKSSETGITFESAVNILDRLGVKFNINFTNSKSEQSTVRLKIDPNGYAGKNLSPEEISIIER